MKHKNHLLTIRHIFKKFMGEGDLTSYSQFVAHDISAHCPSSWSEIHPIETQGIENVKKIDLEYAQAFRFTDINIGHTLAAPTTFLSHGPAKEFIAALFADSRRRIAPLL